jgi:type I restriction enzyme M protein
MVVIRRLDAILEPTKEAVLRMRDQLDQARIANQYAALCQASGEAFYNISPYTLRDLKARAKQQLLRSDFEAYLDGFSSNVSEILEKFKFKNQIQTLIDADVLGSLIEKFLASDVNLSPKPVFHANGEIRLPGLDNHAMGTIFEELIRRFNEENNEEAGEHFTPRDVVKLMADLVFLPIADKIESGTYLVYDGACGTGGMLTVAQERLQALAREHGRDVSIHLYGQEINPETYAITKADLLLQGEGGEAENMFYGSALSQDGFRTQQFDFMLSNPPYGKSWKTDLERMGGKEGIADSRFIITHDGDAEFSLLPRSSDGQLLFLANKLSKMKQDTPLGSRVAEVHNGSSLFTGDAGQGESNIRRWIIENDWLEAIIALPLNMFYNTGIATYIWVLTNRKPEHRRGKVQLIDATAWSQPLRKNLGKKNCEFSAADMQKVIEVFLNFKETEQSKIFPNESFGYWKITVERPLRLKVELNEAALGRFRRASDEAKEAPLANLMERVAEKIGVRPHMDFNLFSEALEAEAQSSGIKLSPKRMKLIQTVLAEKDEKAEPVLKKLRKPGKVEADPPHGLYLLTVKGKKLIAAYEPDSDLRDTEQVPLLEEGGIEAFLRREVLPHVPDAWVDAEATKIGYEISFTHYFYKPQPLRTLQEIRADIEAGERETVGLLEQVLVKVEMAV